MDRYICIVELPMQLKPEELSDDALLKECRLRGWEQYLEGACCAFPLVAGLTVFALLIEMADSLPWFVSLLLSLFCSLGCLLLMHTLSMRRSGPYRKEWDRRHGYKPIGFYSEKAHKKLQAEDAPDWIVVLCGGGLPHGKNDDIELSLWNGPG